MELRYRQLAVGAVLIAQLPLVIMKHDEMSALLAYALPALGQTLLVLSALAALAGVAALAFEIRTGSKR